MGILDTRCVAAQRTRGAHGKTRHFTATLLNPAPWHSGVLLVFYPITLLIVAYYIFLSIPILNQSLIRWLKWRPTTYLN